MPCGSTRWFITLRPRQHGRRFADDVFKCIFLDENVWISLKISLKFVPKVPINNIPALVQIMAWRRLGDKPLSEPMMDSFPTHICLTRPRYFKYTCISHVYLPTYVVHLGISANLLVSHPKNGTFTIEGSDQGLLLQREINFNPAMDK